MKEERNTGTQGDMKKTRHEARKTGRREDWKTRRQEDRKILRQKDRNPGNRKT